MGDKWEVRLDQMISKVLSVSPTGESGDSTCPSHSTGLEDDTSSFQQNFFPKTLGNCTCKYHLPYPGVRLLCIQHL